MPLDNFTLRSFKPLRVKSLLFKKGLKLLMLYWEVVLASDTFFLKYIFYYFLNIENQVEECDAHKILGMRLVQAILDTVPYSEQEENWGMGKSGDSEGREEGLEGREEGREEGLEEGQEEGQEEKGGKRVRTADQRQGEDPIGEEVEDSCTLLSYPALVHLLADDMCKHLLFLLRSPSITVVSQAVSVFQQCFSSHLLLPYLHHQLEAFLQVRRALSFPHLHKRNTILLSALKLCLPCLLLLRCRILCILFK